MTKLIFQKTDIGLGKRKHAVARVFLVPGDGNITINKVSGNQYLQYNDTYLSTVLAPLKAIKLDSQFDIVAFVRGTIIAFKSISFRRCVIDKGS